MKKKVWGENFIETIMMANQSSLVFSITMTIILLVFKLTRAFDVSWIWVFVPIITRVALAIIVVLLSVIVGLLGNILGKYKEEE